MRGVGSLNLTGPTPSPGQVASATPVTHSGSAASPHGKVTMGVEVTLIAAAVIYFLFVLIFRHEKVREAIEPKNVEFNLYSSLSVFLQAAFWILIAKVLVTKLAIWTKAGWAKSLATVVGGL